MEKNIQLNFEKEHVEKILNEFKTCLEKRCFIISRGLKRKENDDFIENYNLNENTQLEMLKSLTIEDFSKKDFHVKDRNKLIYFFGKTYRLTCLNNEVEDVETYIKFCIEENMKSEGKFVIVISFHKANDKINYMYKKE
ncbi:MULTISPECIES: hypothetical protein [unclassified Clostridioides]|uniref:hypothetical protein n=1 Tax=unclassified Clostridioides TaxID=2635829 RepID=UPI001D110154|nr:hypothetical protein [Clostridioides sp. ZZV14-6009]MCC0739957.1 hypothetical protein [Clostridioides sp. ZZV14-5902]